MNLFEAIILGLFQGLTEFLPVSSSGHLELGKHLFGIDNAENFYFSIVVHGATVLSTLFVLRQEVIRLLKGFFAFKLNEETIFVFKLVISMIPVGIAGLFLTEIAKMFYTGNMLSLGLEFLISALFLFLTMIVKPKERPITYLDSFIIGLAQVLAVLPGISRSGATIATGMMLGNKKSDIARFSFLMVLIPVIGANLIEMKSDDFSKEGTSFLIIIVGFLTAFISGYFACKWMISIVQKGNLKWFAVYCIIVGIYSILLGVNVF